MLGWGEEEDFVPEKNKLRLRNISQKYYKQIQKWKETAIQVSSSVLYLSIFFK